jgi:calcium-binding protein CML
MVMVMIDEQHLADIFHRFDTDKDGSLTELQLGALFRSLGLKPDQQRLESVLERADAHSDGLIGFQECADLVLATALGHDKLSNGTVEEEEEQQEQEQADDDEEEDEDDDGDDDAKGLQATTLCTQEQLRSLFRAFDSNGDGFVSEAELASSMARLGHALSEDELAEMMKEADTNGDGRISYDEFVAAISGAALELDQHEDSIIM